MAKVDAGEVQGGTRRRFGSTLVDAAQRFDVVVAAELDLVVGHHADGLLQR